MSIFLPLFTPKKIDSLSIEPWINFPLQFPPLIPLQLQLFDKTMGNNSSFSKSVNVSLHLLTIPNILSKDGDENLLRRNARHAMLRGSSDDESGRSIRSRSLEPRATQVSPLSQSRYSPNYRRSTLLNTPNRLVTIEKRTETISANGIQMTHVYWPWVDVSNTKRRSVKAVGLHHLLH